MSEHSQSVNNTGASTKCWGRDLQCPELMSSPTWTQKQLLLNISFTIRTHQKALGQSAKMTSTRNGTIHIPQLLGPIIRQHQSSTLSLIRFQRMMKGNCTAHLTWAAAAWGSVRCWCRFPLTEHQSNAEDSDTCVQWEMVRTAPA